jgi:hypothetical protein
MPMARRSLPLFMYQFDIRLLGSDPPIWRRILVPDQMTLSGLHHLIQVVMGWEHSHMHEFCVNSIRYGEPDPNDTTLRNNHRVRLRDILREKDARFLYLYDYGDGWQHLVTVEDILTQLDLESMNPRCLDGARACPPEDSGGIGGYAHILEVLQDEQHQEYQSRLTWVGPHFDPECFSVQAINSALALLIALDVTS